MATEQAHDTDVEEFDYSGIDAILQRNNIDMFLSGEKQTLEKVGNPIRFVEPEEFQQAISEQSQDPEKAKLMSALLAYQDMTHGHKACTIERAATHALCSIVWASAGLSLTAHTSRVC